MNTRFALLAATLLVFPGLANADSLDGVYIGLGSGANFMTDQNLRGGGHTGESVGEIGVGSLGYSLGTDTRVELQADFRTNKLYKAASLHAGGNQEEFGGFGNVYHDFSNATILGMVPYIGLGLGYEQVSLANGHAYGTLGNSAAYVKNTGTDGDFAVQAMLGATYALNDVPGLSLTAEYRFTTIPENLDFHGQGFGSGVAARSNAVTEGTFDHAALIGIRYSFNSAPLPVTASPVVPGVPFLAAARTYVVFFDWDRSDLTERARQLIETAAKSSTAVQVTRIEVDGYTDSSGTAAYNMQLSQRRAQTVAAELVRDGVSRASIHTTGFGETNLAVPTANGVRELANRRVEIVLR